MPLCLQSKDIEDKGLYLLQDRQLLLVYITVPPPYLSDCTNARPLVVFTGWSNIIDSTDYNTEIVLDTNLLDSLAEELFKLILIFTDAIHQT